MELVMVVLSLSEILLTTPSQTVITLFSRSGNRGTYQGYYSAFSNAGFSIASFLGPFSFQLFSGGQFLGWYLVAAISAAVGVCFVALSPAIQRQHESSLPHQELSGQFDD
jgi:predicted MFS family arabinose efflux permease